MEKDEITRKGFAAAEISFRVVFIFVECTGKMWNKEVIHKEC